MSQVLRRICFSDTLRIALYIASQKGTGGAFYYATNDHDYGQAYRRKLY